MSTIMTMKRLKLKLKLLPTAAAAARSWLTRLGHRATDVVDVLSFSLSPFSTLRTELVVGPSVLQISQWPGSKVGSGGFVWDGSRRLASHFQRHGDGCAAHGPPGRDGKGDGPSSGPAVRSRPWRGLAVLELGAGTGTGAAGLAASSLGADVTLTDQASFRYPGSEGGGDGIRPPETLLDLMRLNVRNNAAVFEGGAGGGGTGRSRPRVSEMLWGDEEHMARLPPTPAQTEGGYNAYDLICGTDILLFKTAQTAMVRSLRCLSGPSTVVIIEHTDRNGSDDDYPSDLRHFFRLLAEDGLWSPSVVRDHGRYLTLRMVRTREGDVPFSGTIPRQMGLVENSL